MGLLGVVLSGLLYWLTLKNFRQAQRHFKQSADVYMHYLTITLESAFIGFLFFSVTQTTIGRKEWPLVMALAIASRRLSQSQGRKEFSQCSLEVPHPSHYHNEVLIPQSPAAEKSPQ
jgi:hypothetical protein